MPTITRSQLRDQLFHLRGATPCTIIAVTYPQLTGGVKCPLIGMVKRSRVNAMINWQYENAVNRQREREEMKPNFVAMPRSWGQRLHDAVKLASGKNRLLPLVAKDWSREEITEEQLKNIPVDELYLECKPEASLEYRYYCDGHEVDKTLAESWIRQRKPSKRQGTKKEILVRDYSLNSIESITYGGETYSLV